MGKSQPLPIYLNVLVLLHHRPQLSLLVFFHLVSMRRHVFYYDILISIFYLQVLLLLNSTLSCRASSPQERTTLSDSWH